MTINGSGFGSSQGSSTVTFGGVAATATSWSDTRVVARVPASLAVGFADVVVTVNGAASNTSSFLVIPVITDSEPFTTTVGSTVTIAGTSFGDTQGKSTVGFNGTLATPSSWSNTSITVPVPDGATTGPIVVAVNGYATNSVMFYLTPKILNLQPPAGSVGTPITITGNGFGATQNPVTAVSFNGVNATITNWSDISITAVVPDGATTGDVVVTNGNYFGSSGVNFTVGPTGAFISSLSQPSGAIGTQITISGQNFGSGAGTITFNGAPTISTSWSPTSIVTNVPVGATTGNVQVTTAAGGTSNSVPFAVLGPTITSLSTSSGAVGSQLTVNGSGFGSSQSDGFGLVVGGVFVTAQTWSDGQITATVPVGATSGNVYVIQGAVQSNSLPFTVLTPHLDGINPTSGPIGQQITLSGHYFGSTQGQVFIGSKMATVLSWGDQQILVQVADGTNTGVVSVYLNGIFTNAILFTVNTPHLDSISPDHGPAGTQVTLSGSNFGVTAGSITIGNQPAVIQNWSDTQIVANVANNATRGNAIVSQGTLQSNPIFFHLIDPTTTSLTLTPSTLAMVAGSGQTLALRDQNSEPVAGASWGTDNTAVIALSPGDPPLLIGLSPGTANIMVSLGSLTAQAKVSVYLPAAGGGLPPGTLLWSVPDPSASAVLQAVPTGDENMPDRFAMGAMITALTADGQQLWQVPNSGVVAPDSAGGLVNSNNSNGSFNSFGIGRLDGASGLSAWSYTPATSSNPPSSIDPSSVAVHPDNTVFAVENNYRSFATDRLVGFDGATGNVVVQQQIPTGQYAVSGSGGCGSGQALIPGIKGPVTIGPDGSAYMEYWDRNYLGNIYLIYYRYQGQLFQTCDFSEVRSGTLYLLRRDPNGVISTQTLYTYSRGGTNFNRAPMATALPREVIPDGLGGVLAAWQLGDDLTGTRAPHVTHVDVSGNTNDYTLPMSSWCGEVYPFANCPSLIAPDTAYPATSLILGDNNTAFAANTDKVVAFDVSSGSPRWTWTVQQSHKTGFIAALEGGGLAVMDIDTGAQSGTYSENVVRFDAAGNPAYDTWPSTTSSPVSNVDFFIAGDSWVGTTGSADATAVAANPLPLSSSPWVAPQGKGNNSADYDMVVDNFSQNDETVCCNQSEIREEFQRLSTAMPVYPKCNNWLSSRGTIVTPVLLYANLIQNNDFGYGEFYLFDLDKAASPTNPFPVSDYGAFHGSKNPDGSSVFGHLAVSPAITVNTNGAFFNNYDPLGPKVLTFLFAGKRDYKGNSPEAKSEILVHETAHQLLVPYFLSDFGNQKNEDHNEKLVDDNCRALIEGPKINKFSPSNGPAGSVVTITGQNFGDTQGNVSYVMIGAAPNTTNAVVTSWSDTKIIATIPNVAPGVVPVSVSVANRTDSKGFTVK